MNPTKWARAAAELKLFLNELQKRYDFTTLEMKDLKRAVFDEKQHCRIPTQNTVGWLER